MEINNIVFVENGGTRKNIIGRIVAFTQDDHVLLKVIYCHSNLGGCHDGFGPAYFSDEELKTPITIDSVCDKWFVGKKQIIILSNKIVESKELKKIVISKIKNKLIKPQKPWNSNKFISQLTNL